MKNKNYIYFNKSKVAINCENAISAYANESLNYIVCKNNESKITRLFPMDNN